MNRYDGPAYSARAAKELAPRAFRCNREGCQRPGAQWVGFQNSPGDRWRPLCRAHAADMDPECQRCGAFLIEMDGMPYCLACGGP